MDLINQNVLYSITTDTTKNEDEPLTNFELESIFNSNNDSFRIDNDEKYLPSDLLNEVSDRILHPPRTSKKSKSLSSLTPFTTKNTNNYIWNRNSKNNDSVNSDKNIYIFCPSTNEMSTASTASGFINYNTINNIYHQFDINDGPTDPIIKKTEIPRTSGIPLPMNHNNSNEETETPKKGNIMNLQKIDLQLLWIKCKTHHGSIQSQNLISSWNETEFNELVILLCPYWIDIMCSHYGNYFIQKIFQRLNHQQRLLIFTVIEKRFYLLCCNNSGTYSIQALIDVLMTPDEEQILANLIEPHLLHCFCNEHAHHVIQKIIINYPEHKREYLNYFVLTHLQNIACNQFGALCLTKFIKMNSNLYLRLEFMNNLKRNFYSLVRNRHGASFLTFIFKRFGINFSGFIIEEVQNKFVFLATQEESSKFVGKILYTTNKLNSNIIISWIWCIIQNESIWSSLLQNQHGINILLILTSLGTQEQQKILKHKTIIFRNQQ